MTDILERLRTDAEISGWHTIMSEAADEIERLREELSDSKRSRRALNDEIYECLKELKRLREIELAARWFAMHTPAKHIPGLLQRTKYEQLQDALAKLKEDK